MRAVRTTGLMIFLLFMTVAVDNIGPVRYSTYEYYGRTLNVDEFLELVEQDVPLHCGMIPSSDIYPSFITSG